MIRLWARMRAASAARAEAASVRAEFERSVVMMRAEGDFGHAKQREVEESKAELTAAMARAAKSEAEAIRLRQELSSVQGQLTDAATSAERVRKEGKQRLESELTEALAQLESAKGAAEAAKEGQRRAEAKRCRRISRRLSCTARPARRRSSV